jgi:hypothetical protein
MRIPDDVAALLDDAATGMGVPPEVVLRAAITIALWPSNTDALCAEAEAQMDAWARRRGWLPPEERARLSPLGAMVHEALSKRGVP